MSDYVPVNLQYCRDIQVMPSLRLPSSDPLELYQTFLSSKFHYLDRILDLLRISAPPASARFRPQRRSEEEEEII